MRRPDGQEPELGCAKCGQPLDRETAYGLQGRTLCQGCLEAALAGPERKTHWQYIRSIKGSYLTPGRKKETGDEEA